MSYPSMPPTPDPQPVVTCYRHPDRRAGVRCQRCERAICPSCMTQASVGFQCPECVKQGARTSPTYSPGNLPGSVPLATYVLIGLTVAAFVGQLVTLTGGSPVGLDLESTVGVRGALYGPLVHAGEWWRLVTSGFLHGGLIHIGLNMYFLYLIGPQLEKLLGPVRFVGLYLASLLAGSLGMLLISPTSAGLGASGAVFGLLGAAAAVQLANRVSLWESGLGRVILINVVFTFVFPGIAIGAHLGGLVGGGLVGYGLYLLEQRRVPALAGAALAFGAAAAFFLVALVIAPSGLRLP